MPKFTRPFNADSKYSKLSVIDRALIMNYKRRLWMKRQQLIVKQHHEDERQK